MDNLTLLNDKRKQYLELSQLYHYEVQKGAALEGLTFLKEKMRRVQKEITDLENKENELLRGDSH